jgi:hypothetical protein
MEKQRLDMDALNHLALRMENDKETIVQAFKAETDRLKALIGGLSEEQASAIISRTVKEMLSAPNPAQNLSQETMDPDAAYEAGMNTVLAPV